MNSVSERKKGKDLLGFLILLTVFLIQLPALFSLSIKVYKREIKERVENA